MWTRTASQISPGTFRSHSFLVISDSTRIFHLLLNLLLSLYSIRAYRLVPKVIGTTEILEIDTERYQALSNRYFTPVTRHDPSYEPLEGFLSGPRLSVGKSLKFLCSDHLLIFPILISHFLYYPILIRINNVLTTKLIFSPSCAHENSILVIKLTKRATAGCSIVKVNVYLDASVPCAEYCLREEIPPL